MSGDFDHRPCTCDFCLPYIRPDPNDPAVLQPRPADPAVIDRLDSIVRLLAMLVSYHAPPTKVRK